MQEDPETGFFEHWSLTLSLLASENDQCHKSAYEHVLGMAVRSWLASPRLSPKAAFGTD